MTTQDDDSETTQESAKTQLRPSATEWKLVPKDPDHAGEIIPVRGELSLGREGCDISLTSAHASRKHAKVLLVGGTLRVEDLGSANGTFVNDKRIEACDLVPGDELRFDTESFIVDGPVAEPAGNENRTALRPAPQEVNPDPVDKAVSSREAAPEKQAEPQRTPDGGGSGPETAPGAPAETEQPASEPHQGESGRKAWYERETPNMTRKVESGDLRDQFAEGATQIVRGVRGVEMPSLIGTSGDWAGRVINLDKEAMTIGRAGSDIILDEASVSTKHARIVRDGERWKVVDLMSANGVYVNGKKSQVAYLSPGDAVRFGRLEMRFVIDSTEVASRSAGDADDMIVGSSRASSTGGTWLYMAIGFVVVVIVGAYLLLTGQIP